MMYDKIKELAKKKGVSINKMEKDLEFGSSTISKWSKSIPSADKLKKVADYLEVDMNELLEDKQTTH
ncbi:helix-turn-helix domain-containing protein [Latilactobacillus curvatus]|uniref:helix-turn-helix domain-containing protein n=1 Tax=Latilactobacillus curvatus TaxID=28038 RepID=UPI00280B6D3E|nr:helix-turn-helix transcriptional regulator [Latilactobacillus curvatus]